MCLKGCVTLWVEALHYLAKFNDQGPCSSINIMYLIVFVTSCDRKFRRLCDFCASYNHSTLYSNCGSRDAAYLIYHVTLQDRVIKGSCNFMEGSCSL